MQLKKLNETAELNHKHRKQILRSFSRMSVLLACLLYFLPFQNHRSSNSLKNKSANPCLWKAHPVTQPPSKEKEEPRPHSPHTLKSVSPELKATFFMHLHMCVGEKHSGHSADCFLPFDHSGCLVRSLIIVYTKKWSKFTVHAHSPLLLPWHPQTAVRFHPGMEAPKSQAHELTSSHRSLGCSHSPG